MAEDLDWLVGELAIRILAAEAIRRARREFVEECRRREDEPWARPR